MDTYIIITLIIFLCSSFTALFGMLFKLCYASKCQRVSLCCDCLKIERDTIHEASIRTLNLDNNIKMPNVLPNKQEIDL